MRPCDLQSAGCEPHLSAVAGVPAIAVRENLILGGPGAPGTMLSRLIGRRDLPAFSADANRMLGFFRLDHLSDEPAAV